MANSNPHGANQWKPDPRQTLFLANYLDPKSKTFSDAFNSAVKAGYEKTYAENILNVDNGWLLGFIERRKRMLNKAENRLEKSIGSKNEKIAVDVAMFIAETLGKKEGYSKRTELTGKDGKPIEVAQIVGMQITKDGTSPDTVPDKDTKTD
jgi:hypothetical protein